MEVLGVVLLLIAAGIAAGISGAVAGLASIFSFPALLLIGLNPITANVTNSVALTALSLGSVPASYPEWKAHRPILKKLVIPVLVGGITGALLLLATPGQSFTKIAAVLIIVASFSILLPRRSGESPQRFWLLVLIMLAVGIYCGYFGAGAGSITMAATMLILGVDLKEASSLKNVLLAVANTMGVILFAFSGRVDWILVVPLALGFYIGGRIGPIIVRKANPKILRWFVAGFGLFVAITMLVR